jgi:branched-chain amino acid transport system substrate-binding protein
VNTFLSIRANLSLMALCLFSTATFAAEPGVSDKEIILGSTVSLSGGKNSYGVAALQGMSLYFSAVNATGGVNGRKISHRVLDDEEKASNAEANARKLLEDGAFILFGSIDGGPSAAVIKVANEAKVPFFGPLAGPPTLRKPYQALVFPVRAEHKDEFRALMSWGKKTGLKTVGFLYADTDVGRLHLENVRAISQELGIELTLALPFKAETTDAQIDEMVKSISARQPGMFVNHGSAVLYQKLVARAKKNGSSTTFMGVNSGSSQIVKGLGTLAQGMVFSQVVPNPMERKREIAREYQDALLKVDPRAELSYGGLEGYMTAKALVLALRENGRALTRESLVKTLESAKYDLGGLTVCYSQGDHEGSRFVDLSIVSRQGKFVQ